MNDEHIELSDAEKLVAKPVVHGDTEFPETNRNAHAWKMQGANGMMHCPSIAACPHPHGHHIGIDSILAGIDEDGYPIIKKIKVAQPQNVEGPDLEAVAQT